MIEHIKNEIINVVNGSSFQGSKMKNFVLKLCFISLRTELFLSWKNLIFQVMGLKITDSLLVFQLSPGRYMLLWACIPNSLWGYN